MENNIEPTNSYRPLAHFETFMSPSIDKLAQSLSKAQHSIENVSKDNKAFNHKYADLAACLEAIKKPLHDNELSISQIISTQEEKIILITLLMHSSGQWIKSIFPVLSVFTKQNNEMQNIGAGLTYCRRYALSAIVGLTQKDDDAEIVTQRKEKEVIELNTNEILELSNVLKELCLEHNITDVKDFANKNNIKSKEPESVRRAINNFDELKNSYLSSKS